MKIIALHGASFMGRNQSPPIIESFEDFGYMQYMPNNVLVPGWPGQNFFFAFSGAKFNALSTLLLSICKILKF